MKPDAFGWGKLIKTYQEKNEKKNSEAFRTKKLKAKRKTEINCVKFSQAMYKTDVYEKKLPIKEMFGYTWAIA